LVANNQPTQSKSEPPAPIGFSNHNSAASSTLWLILGRELGVGDGTCPANDYTG
jgi:hypothetical protein